jgi:hypothetical protein
LGVVVVFMGRPKARYPDDKTNTKSISLREQNLHIGIHKYETEFNLNSM